MSFWSFSQLYLSGEEGPMIQCKNVLWPLDTMAMYKFVFERAERPFKEENAN